MLLSKHACMVCTLGATQLLIAHEHVLVTRPGDHG